MVANAPSEWHIHLSNLRQQWGKPSLAVCADEATAGLMVAAMNAAEPQGVIPAMDGRRWKRGVDSSLVLSALTDALGRFAPAGHYFGVRTVNGSPWGFWPALDRCG